MHPHTPIGFTRWEHEDVTQSRGNFRWEEMAENSGMAVRGVFFNRLRVIKTEHDWGRGLA